MSTSSTPDSSAFPADAPDSGVYAEQGTFVVFSLATNILHHVNKNVHVKEAVKLFKPQKYLGLILSEVTYTVPGRGGKQHLRLAVVSTCPPQGDYARRGDLPGMSWLYEHDFLRLDAHGGPDDPERPVLAPQPPLPWKGCVVYTVHDTLCEVGQLHAHSDPWEVSPRDLEAVETSLYEDDGRRKERLRAWQEGRISWEEAQDLDPTDAADRLQLIIAGEFPEEVNEEISREVGRHPTGFSMAIEEELVQRYGDRPDWRAIVNLSEDLSELSRVPYPGDFREECMQLKHLMDLAWERLPYDNVLSKWPKLDDELGHWDDYHSNFRDSLTSVSISTSGRRLSQVSTDAFISEAPIPLPESPSRFQELPDDYVPEEGVTMFQSDPEKQRALILRAPPLSSTFLSPFGVGHHCVAVEEDNITLPGAMTRLADISMATMVMATPTLPEALVPLPDSPPTEQHSFELIDGGDSVLPPVELSEAMVSASRSSVSVGSVAWGSVRSNSAHDHEAPDKASGSASVPGIFRRKPAKLTSAAREATQKAACSGLRTSHAIRGCIAALVKTAGRCGRRVVHEVVRCIVEPL